MTTKITTKTISLKHLPIQRKVNRAKSHPIWDCIDVSSYHAPKNILIYNTDGIFSYDYFETLTQYLKAYASTKQAELPKVLCFIEQKQEAYFETYKTVYSNIEYVDISQTAHKLQKLYDDTVTNHNGKLPTPMFVFVPFNFFKDAEHFYLYCRLQHRNIYLIINRQVFREDFEKSYNEAWTPADDIRATELVMPPKSVLEICPNTKYCKIIVRECHGERNTYFI